MTATRSGSGGGADVEGLPAGSLLVVPLAAVAAAVAIVPLALGALLLAATAVVGLGVRTLLVSTAAGGVVLLARGPSRAWDIYVNQAPVWRLGDALAAHGYRAWLLAVLPLAVAPASLSALGLRVWLDYRAPFWVERRRRRPLEERLRSRRERRALARRRPRADGAIPIGLDERGTVVAISPQELAQHALVLGATGSGKTTTVLQLLRGLLAPASGLVVVDLKGDPDLTRELREIAEERERPFELWTFEGPASWNPLAHGDATELMDKLIGLEEWSEPHYKRAAQRYLHSVLRALELARERPELGRVTALLAPEALPAFVHSPEGRAIPPAERKRLDLYCAQLDRSSQSAIQGLGNRLALLAETRAGAQLRGAPGAIDLYRTLAEGRLTVFSLDSQKYGETAAHVAALVAQDLKTVASARLAGRQRGAAAPTAYLALDEFSAMRSDHVLGLLARGRSSGIAVILATQELADLARIEPAFAEQVLGNTNVKLIHRQDVPESAERLAGVAGTRAAFQETLQTDRAPFAVVAGRRVGGRSGRNTGLGTIREVEQYVVHPNVLKQLEQGTAVLIRKHPRAHATRVRIVPPLPPIPGRRLRRAGASLRVGRR